MIVNEFIRKSFTVNAVEVDFTNIHEVAEWCKGTVAMETTKLMGTETQLPVIVIKGQGEQKGKEFKAALGCYVVELKGSFRVYKQPQFFSSFEEKSTMSKESSISAAIEWIEELLESDSLPLESIVTLRQKLWYKQAELQNSSKANSSAAEAIDELEADINS